MQPINYLTQVADPFAQSLQGFQLGSGIVETQQKQALAEQQRQQKQAIFEQQQQQQQLAAQEQARFFAKPNPTMRDALQFAAVLPKDRADALRPYIENFSKAQQQSVLKTNRQILSALQVNPETAIKFLKDYATAQRNSGDQEEALLYESIAEQAADPTRGPSMAFKSMVTVTSLIPGAKEMFEAIDKASTTARTEELAPSVLKKSVADANVAVAMAEQKVLEAAGTPARLEAEQNLRLAQIAQQEALTAASVGGEGRAAGLAPSVLEKSVADAAAAVADAEKKVSEAKDTPARLEAEQALRVAQAEQQRALTAASVGGETRAAEKAPSELIETRAKAEKARIESKYAEKIKIQELEKQAADLGLTKAQTNSAIATTKKLGQETAKIVIELAALKANNGLDPAKAFDQEEKLRREYQSRTKAYGELGTIYSNIEASANAKTGPGDIALITGFQKMLDPGSVVRETEFATSRDTAGVVQRLLNESQKLQSGQLFALDSKQRQEYVNLAKQYLEAAQKKAVEDKKALGVVVKNYRLNPDNVFGTEPTAAAPLPVSATIGGRTYARPANFTDAQWRDYLKANGVIQ
jgi:hypothetical protein